jgi:lipid A 3-O-deacylase
MRTIKLNYLKYFVLFFCLFFIEAKSETKISNNSKQLNFYAGVFDFSDDKQKAGLFGIQHQNENLQRDTFLGNVSPITGGFITENSAIYIYSGVEWNFDLGGINLTPSFAPGLYEEGDGKDLGHTLEFKTEVQLSYDISNNTSLGVSYNHISNASLGDKNPGANSYEINFIKNF